MSKRAFLVSAVLPGLLIVSSTVSAADLRFADLLLTPDQQGQRLFDRGQFAEAAERFADPMRRGVALYRAGDFQAAAASFAQIDSAEAAFNRGNALILLGHYEGAIQAFRRAHQLRPDWPAAATNLAIAEARMLALAPPEDDAGGTGGQLEADEIVLDSSGRTKKAQGEQMVEGAAPTSEEELRALWLRRVQTRPADFLKVRFAQQLARRQSQGEVE
ncbi:MAG: tetratricopeptide repeat protein [Pseudomonadota bacterium]|nr:tetratricopeptide repeat protein [Pseudomonadota bacterium]